MLKFGNWKSKRLFLSQKELPIEEFATGDSLELTRVDSNDKKSILEEGKVVTPIQNKVKESQHLEDNSFIIGNRISTLCYEISCNGDKKKVVKPVSVNRVMDNLSILEFSHLFEIPYSWRGHDITFNIRVQDTFNKIVEGSEEKIIIQSKK
ncbi:hypothetical protein OL233_06225 [Vagococcus sp. PNs007]|uniref:Uncharacterized protein n=1 Tax=Vagococcus proximus TaxID=2991417 RepID=A0ABT5X1K8_9ENTE|nr:hypothetical protein [Vagococcus proximus]MDF0479885.1 hypothetical protein [Vagococcus proximus]